MTRRFLRPAVLAVLAWVAGGCGGSVSVGGGGIGGGPSGGQVAEVGAAAQDQIETDLSGLTLRGSITPILVSSTGGVFPRSAFRAGSCPDSSASPDSDGDGIANDITLSYNNPPCSFTGILGGTVERTGQIRIVDASAQDGTSFRAIATSLVWIFTDPTATKSFTVTRNGSRWRRGSADTSVVFDTVSVAWQRAGKATAAIQRTATLTFRADTAGRLGTLAPLPSGTLKIAGDLAWQRSTENFSFILSTPVPIHFNATCTTSGRHIDAGEFRATGPINGVNGYVRIHWSACGVDPLISFVSLP
jgi:hypothetical protein